jgi:hypothetical protein
LGSISYFLIASLASAKHLGVQDDSQGAKDRVGTRPSMREIQCTGWSEMEILCKDVIGVHYRAGGDWGGAYPNGCRSPHISRVAFVGRRLKKSRGAAMSLSSVHVPGSTVPAH